MQSDRQKLRWGILSTGKIAKTFADELQYCRLGYLEAVAGTSAQKAADFAIAYPNARALENFNALVLDSDVDAIYVASPHPSHLHWACKALEAGKAVLCEKPITMNYSDTLELVECARKNKVLLTEAFKYRCQPHTAQILDWIRTGVIGRIGLIQASFSFNSSKLSADHRLFAKELGGGAILDLGCYPLSVARLIAGAAMHKNSADPVELFAVGNCHQVTGVDTEASALLKFEGGIHAEISCATTLHRKCGLFVYGDSGYIHCENFFTRGKEIQVTLKLQDQPAETHELRSEFAPFTLEADAFADAFLGGKTEADFMPLDDSLGNMRALDRWRQSLGAFYD